MLDGAIDALQTSWASIVVSAFGFIFNCISSLNVAGVFGVSAKHFVTSSDF